MNILQNIKNKFTPKEIHHHHFMSGSTGYVGDIVNSVFDGSPFEGSFGATKSYQYVDYWTLRERSSQLFKENPYCKGIIRRLITNEIHTGLTPEIMPIPEITGMTDEQAQNWGDSRETDWKLWGDNPLICDHKKKQTFFELEADCRQTALISGDCLVVLITNKKTRLPSIQLIDGVHIQNSIGAVARKGNRVVHGVELDKNNRQVAFWVRDENNPLKSKRISAWGEVTGRRTAWLVYGSETRLDEIRGEPILSCMLYMIKDLDRGRNAELRAFVINAMLPMFIKNAEGEIPSTVIDQGATKTGTVDDTSITGTGVVSTQGRKWNFAKMLPGTVPQNLAKGEEPVSFNTQRPNANYGKFEETIINTFAWALEVPPEIVRLMFQSNFSASRQANNEFDNYLQKRNKINGTNFNQPIYIEHTIQSALMGIITAPGLLDAWRNPKQWKIFGAWMNVVWVGISRPSVDIKKEVDAAEKAINAGIGDYDFWNRRITGQSYRHIVKMQARQRAFAKENGVVFAAEENQNKEPAQTPEQIEQQQQIEDLAMRLDEQQEIIETIESRSK